MAVPLVVAVALPAAAASQSWTVVATPSAVAVDKATTVTLAITNTSSGGSRIACVTVSIPTVSFKSISVAKPVTDPPWSAAGSGGSPEVITAKAAPIGDGLHTDDVLILKLKVTGTVEGSAPWTADAFANAGCTGDWKTPITVDMAVAGGSTPTPTQTPTRTPRPTASPSPSPTPTRTPGPTASPTPTPTPTPSATPTPSPAPTERPTPDRTPDPGPTSGPGSGSPGQGGTGAGSTGKGGGSGGGSHPPPSPVLAVGGDTPGSFEHLDSGGALGFGAIEWAAPGVLLAGPGLLLLALIAAQAMGALAWLPLVRSRIGGFGPARRRRTTRGA